MRDKTIMDALLDILDEVVDEAENEKTKKDVAAKEKLEELFAKETDSLAKTVKQMYDSFVKVGFSDEQSMELVKITMEYCLYV